jgi:hypothetical protein
MIMRNVLLFLFVIVILSCFSSETVPKRTIKFNYIGSVVFQLPDSVPLIYIGYLTRSPWGDYYVADIKSNRVFKFDSTGKMKAWAGGYGQAPKELGHIYGMKMFHQKLFVLDVLNRKINEYNQNLEYIQSVKIPDGIVGYDFEFLNDSTYILATLNDSFNNKQAKILAFISTSPPVILKRFGKIDKKYDQYEIFNFWGMYFFRKQDDIYVGFRATERIHHYKLDGTFIRTFGTPLKKFTFVDRDLPLGMELTKKIKLTNRFYRIDYIFGSDNYIYVQYSNFDEDTTPANYSLEKKHSFLGRYTYDGTLDRMFTELPGGIVFYDNLKNCIYIYEQEYPQHRVGVYRLEE